MALLAGATLLLLACAPPQPPVQPLPAAERAEARAFLEQVARLNVRYQADRLHLRWWIPEVPLVIWEKPGSDLQSALSDAVSKADTYRRLAREARHFESVPSSAVEAQVALVESLETTTELIALHGEVLEVYLHAHRAKLPLPPRVQYEPRLLAARQRADLASAEAERALQQLVRRYEADRNGD